MKKAVSVYLPKPLLEQMDKAAKVWEVSRSEAINLILLKWWAKIEQ